MDAKLVFKVGRGPKSEDVAREFAAFLLGSRAHGNMPGGLGPYRNGGSDYWQLDHTNDYWMSVDENSDGTTTVSIRCRYDSQAEVIRACAALYRAKYPNSLLPEEK